MTASLFLLLFMVLAAFAPDPSWAGDETLRREKSSPHGDAAETDPPSETPSQTDPEDPLGFLSDEPLVVPDLRFVGARGTVLKSSGSMEQVIVEGSLTDFEKILTEAMQIDGFFSDAERFEEELRVSRLRVRADAFYRDGTGVDFDFNLRGRFVLPQTDNRLVLLLSGDFDGALGDEDNPQQSDIKSLLEPEDEREDGVLAIQGFLAATDRLNISIQAGGRLRGGSPIAFVGPRYRQTFDVGPLGLMRVLVQARWFTDEGFAVRGFVDFDRRLSDRFFLRVTPRADWREEDDGIFYGLDFDLTQEITGQQRLRYQVAMRAATQPEDEIRRVTFRLNYRRRLFWDWFALEVAPEISLLEERDYAVTPGIFIRGDVIFGPFGLGF
ncbi:MAG: hypothetical protein ACFB6R_14230 [Alphaproteobacteria bacterium]